MKKLDFKTIKALQKQCGTYATALMLKKRGFSLQAAMAILVQV